MRCHRADGGGVVGGVVGGGEIWGGEGGAEGDSEVLWVIVHMMGQIPLSVSVPVV